MLTVRVIPVLLLKDGRMIKTVRFGDYRDVGDPLRTVRVYDAQGADELIFLDISATLDGRRALFDLVSLSARECQVPLTVGGGVRTVEDARLLFRAGADRISLSTAAVEKPDFIERLAEEFGRANIVVCIDAVRNEDGRYVVSTRRATVKTDLEPVPWAERVADLGAGEIMLHFVDREGTMDQGYDLDLLARVVGAVPVPVIACGGVGDLNHLAEGASVGGASAVAAASIFHFTDQSPIKAHSFLHNLGLPVCLG